MEDQCKPVVDHQKRLTHAMREVVKKEVINTVSFWEDIIDGVIHSEKFSHLLQFARDPTISLFALRTTGDLLNCFWIPMTRAAYNEFLDLQTFLNNLPPHQP
jgi:hypothetical protein